MTTPTPSTRAYTHQIAAALTLHIADPRDHLAALAAILQHHVPAHTAVLSITDPLSGAPTRVAQVRVSFGPCQYRLRVDATGALAASRWLLHGRTCAAAETLPLELWIAFLAIEIAFVALGSPVMRRTVERLAA